jgi:hypothetical protein
VAVSAPIRLLDERRYAPPRIVEVKHDGRWWPGFQSRWLLCDDGRRWMAQVEYTAQHDWGLGKHLESVPPERLRMVARD